MSEFPPDVVLPAEGSRVELVRWAPSEVIDDHTIVPKGTQGKVLGANRLQVHVIWDNGRTLSMVPGDLWAVVA